MNKGYCEKCGHFLREVRGNFIDDKGRYLKKVCDTCGQLKKERLGEEDE